MKQATDPRPDLDALADGLDDWKDTIRALIESNHDARVIEALGTVLRAITKAQKAVADAKRTINQR